MRRPRARRPSRTRLTGRLAVVAVVATVIFAHTGNVGYAHWTTQALTDANLGTGFLGLDVPDRPGEFRFECEAHLFPEDPISFIRFWDPSMPLGDPVPDGTGGVKIEEDEVEVGSGDYWVDPALTQLGDLGLGGTRVAVYLNGVTVWITGWVEHPDLPGRYVGFYYETNGTDVVLDVKAGRTIWRTTLTEIGLWSLDGAPEGDRMIVVLCDAGSQTGEFTVWNFGSIPSTPYFELSRSPEDPEDDCSRFEITLTLFGSGVIFSGPLCDLLGTQIQIVPQLDPGDSVVVSMEVSLIEPTLGLHEQLVAQVTLVQWNSGAPGGPSFLGWSESQTWEVGLRLNVEPSPDELAVELFSAEEPAGDEAPDEGSPAGETPVEEALVEEPSADDPPADDPLAEEPPADEPPADEPPAEEPPADDPPAVEPPGEEPPSDEPPGDEPPADGPLAEEPPGGDPPEADSTSDDPPADDPPVQEPPADEPPSEEPPAEEPATEPAPASLAGHVWDDLDGDWVKVPGGGEPGVRKTTVILYDERGHKVAQVKSDDDGNYLFTDLEPGSYVVEFHAPEGYGFADPIEDIPDDLASFLEQLAEELGVAADKIVVGDVTEFKLDATGAAGVGVTEAISLEPGDNTGLADAPLVVLPVAEVAVDSDGGENAGSTPASDTDLEVLKNPNAVAAEPEEQPGLGGDAGAEPDGDGEGTAEPEPGAGPDDGEGETSPASELDPAEAAPDSGAETPPVSGGDGGEEQP